MIDTVAMLVRHLLADPAVAGKTTDQVAGQRLPPDWTPPFCRVAASVVVPGSWPAPTWWNALTQVDCYADLDGEAFDLAAEVQRSVLELIGTAQPEAVVQEVRPSSFQPLYDGTLELPRVIVSFTIYGRQP